MIPGTSTRKMNLYLEWVAQGTNVWRDNGANKGEEGDACVLQL